MRQILILLVLLNCCGSIDEKSAQATDQDLNKTIPTQRSLEKGAGKRTEADSPEIVMMSVDDKTIERFEYYQGKLLRRTMYNSETNERESEMTFDYVPEGELRNVAVSGVDLGYEKEMIDFFSNRDFLKTLGIQTPKYGELVSPEISDIASVLSSLDKQVVLDAIEETNETQRTYKLLGLESRIRFEPSFITRLVGGPVFVRHYELMVENGQPIQEKIFIANGVLTRSYSYYMGRIKQVTYNLSTPEESEYLERRFEFQSR